MYPFCERNWNKNRKFAENQIYKVMETIALTKEIKSQEIKLNGAKKIQLKSNEGVIFKYRLVDSISGATRGGLIHGSGIVDIDELQLSFVPDCIELIFHEINCTVTYLLKGYVR